MPDRVIEVQNIARIYRVGDIDVRALQDVSLVIERGEFVAIMGSSGSGKSTLMSILGCLDQPTSGHYRLEGVDVARLSEPDLARVRSERLGFVFQSFNLLARTSAIENVALPLFYSQTAPADQASRFKRARAALEFLGLADREGNTPGQLSGGQQQRVAIARALINNPSLILADEPTGNLDTRTSHDIMATLQTLNRQAGVTIVMVTHEPDIAAYADRVVTMRDGLIISDERHVPTQSAAARPQESTKSLAALTAPAATALVRPVQSIYGFTRMVTAAALQALGRNKTRSMLTMLGVFIGVAALIAMVAVGQGANDAVRKQIESLGTNLLRRTYRRSGARPTRWAPSAT
jgi:macrolide transport system ATP-binding/permease protein